LITSEKVRSRFWFAGYSSDAVLRAVIAAGSDRDFLKQPTGRSSFEMEARIAGGVQPAELSVPRPEYPRPEFYRSPWLNLNGQWDFALDLSDSGEERGLPAGEGFDRKIEVPFAPESKLSGIGFPDFIAAAWYKRLVSIPADWKGQRIKLNFEAADYETTIWVNGQKVGTHRGGYTPFSFDLTDFCTGRKMSW